MNKIKRQFSTFRGGQLGIEQPTQNHQNRDKALKQALNGMSQEALNAFYQRIEAAKGNNEDDVQPLVNVHDERQKAEDFSGLTTNEADELKQLRQWDSDGSMGMMPMAHRMRMRELETKKGDK